MSSLKVKDFFNSKIVYRSSEYFPAVSKTFIENQGNVATSAKKGTRTAKATTAGAVAAARSKISRF